MSHNKLTDVESGAPTMPRNALFNKILLELCWWAVTAIVIWLILNPIYQSMREWPFWGWNVIFIVSVITLWRYILLFPHTLIAKKQIVKFILMVLMVPFTFKMIEGLHGFMTFIEEKTFESLTGHLPPRPRKSLERYIWVEMLFFGAGSILAGPAFAFRMLISVWRTRNQGSS